MLARRRAREDDLYAQELKVRENEVRCRGEEAKSRRLLVIEHMLRTIRSSIPYRVLSPPAPSRRYRTFLLWQSGSSLQLLQSRGGR